MTSTLPIVAPYDQLRVGQFAVNEWGGYIHVLATADRSLVLVLDVTDDGRVSACMPWHLGPDERFGDPLRVLRDEEMAAEDSGDRLTFGWK